ncbi:MAG: glycosyltransferase [Lewinellaceae bacterium]|nr:glycosyltransferase [Lewinellaceae bacterium]
MVARICLPFYRHAYTVGPALAGIFEKKYGIPFGVVRNMPSEAACPPAGSSAERKETAGRVLLYQGALNEGRGIEQTLVAMQQLGDFELWLAGEGDLSEMLRKRAIELGVQDRVRFLGWVRPANLKTLTPQAWIGINVLENKGLSYYYSLANKFFDYVQAGVPVLTMNFPEYRALHAEHAVALLLDNLSSEAVVRAVRYLQENPEAYQTLKQNTLLARQEWNWEKEEQALLASWNALLNET